MQEKLDNLENKSLIENMSFDFMVFNMLHRVWQSDYRAWQKWIRM